MLYFYKCQEIMYKVIYKYLDTAINKEIINLYKWKVCNNTSKGNKRFKMRIKEAYKER